MLAGFLVGTLFVARLISGALRKQAPENFARSVGWFALALLVVLLFAQVPFGGSLLLALLAIAGMGACAVELYGRRRTYDQLRLPPVRQAATT